MHVFDKDQWIPDKRFNAADLEIIVGALARVYQVDYRGNYTLTDKQKAERAELSRVKRLGMEMLETQEEWDDERD